MHLVALGDSLVPALPTFDLVIGNQMFVAWPTDVTVTSERASDWRPQVLKRFLPDMEVWKPKKEESCA